MKNKGIKIVGGIVAVLIVGFAVFTLSIDGMVKSGIEENGSELLDTEVSVDDVDVSLFNGSGSISGFTVQNPEGFSDEPAVHIGEASMKVDLGSLFSDQIIVEEIIVKSPELFFEQKGIGANLKTLNDNMSSGEDTSSKTTLVINYLRVENGTVRVSTTIDRERTAEASLSEFELEGIGRDGSNTVQQSVRQVMEPLLQEAIEEALKSGITDQLKNKVEDLLGN